jgi:hypothetical protein
LQLTPSDSQNAIGQLGHAMKQASTCVTEAIPIAGGGKAERSHSGGTSSANAERSVLNYDALVGR